MNQKVILAILIVIGVIAAIGMPMLYNATRPAPETMQQASLPPEPTPPEPTPPPPPPPVEPEPAPLVWEGTHEPPPRTLPQYRLRQQKGGRSKGDDRDSQAKAAEFVGSAWQVDSPYGPITVELGANGQAVASHSMVGNIPASWRVQGDKLIANASVMGHNINIDAKIQNGNLVAPGQNIRRVR